MRCASAIRCARATAASWLAWPKLNSRSKIPTVEGAYTSSNTRGVPPARSTFASSMLSAPHIIPAMIVVSFPAGLTAPDLTRVLGSSTCSPINRERPVCSASSSTGTKPPADTRFRSSSPGGRAPHPNPCHARAIIPRAARPLRRGPRAGRRRLTAPLTDTQS